MMEGMLWELKTLGMGKHDSALGKWWVHSSLTVLGEGKQWTEELVHS